MSQDQILPQNSQVFREVASEGHCPSVQPQNCRAHVWPLQTTSHFLLNRGKELLWILVAEYASILQQFHWEECQIGSNFFRQNNNFCTNTQGICIINHITRASSSEISIVNLIGINRLLHCLLTTSITKFTIKLNYISPRKLNQYHV